MRNSTIILTALVAVLAGGLAWSIAKPGQLQSVLNKPAEQASTATSDVDGNLTEAQAATNTAPAPVGSAAAMLGGDAPADTSSTTKVTAADAGTPETTSTEQTATDTATPAPAETTTADATAATGESQTGGMTPIDLDKASARLNSEVPAAGNAATADATATEASTPVAEAAADDSADIAMDVDAAMADRSLGSPAAPITVEGFSSLSCPHCAMFHNTILPQIKEEYIDKGLVRWVFKGFPLNDPALKAEMLARCAPDNQYIALEDLMYKNQERWAFTSEPMPNLSLLLKIAGIDEKMFAACVNNKDLETRLAKAIQDNAVKYKLTSTPTFVLNKGAKTIVGAGSFNGMAADLDYLLRQLKVEPPVHKIPASATEF